MQQKFLFLILFYLLCQLTNADELRIATTTSTKGSGLLDLLVPAYEKATGDTLKIASVGTGTALRMGRQGLVDVIFVHAPIKIDDIPVCASRFHELLNESPVSPNDPPVQEALPDNAPVFPQTAEVVVPSP